MGRVIKLRNRQVNIFDVESLLEEIREDIGDEAYNFLLDEYTTQEETIEDLNTEIFDLQNQLKDYED